MSVKRTRRAEHHVPRHLAAATPARGGAPWVRLAPSRRRPATDRTLPRRSAPGPAAGRRLTAFATPAMAAAVLALVVAVVAESSGRNDPLQATGGERALRPAALEVQPPACDAASVAARAGITLVVGLPGVTEADHPLVDRLAEVGVGGVMLRDENLLDEEQARALVDGLHERLGEQVLVALDEEGGRVTSLRSLVDETPSARRLGRAGVEAAAEAGAELGTLLRSLGIDWIFAPVVDLDDGPFDGVIGDRSFGAEPHEVAQLAGAFADELQDAGIAVTLKHFPGHGGEGDPHIGDTVDVSSRGALVREELVPFEELIASGADTVMVGHVIYPMVWGPLPASLEGGAYEMLRSRGFDGVAVTDALGMGAIHLKWGFDVAPAMALAAGADAVLVNQGDRIEELVWGIVEAVEHGNLSEARLDEAVARMLDLRDQPTTGILCPKV